MTPFDIQKHLRDFEDRFDSAQAELRRSGALWSLAAFGALAALFSHSVSGIEDSVSGRLLAGVVGFLGSLGLSTLWILDQAVYQKLLHSVFVYGMRLEKDNETLPPIRTTLYVHSSNISWKLSFYYFAPGSVLFFVGTTMTFSNLFRDFQVFRPLASFEELILLVLFLIQIIATIVMITLAIKDHGLKPYLAGPKDDLLTSARQTLEDRISKMALSPKPIE